ncbi:hypothetical protein [Microbacterium karelineae]|uniref:hypothetical protein n=1 Tax=Microbacterium karelineae TaxID=2654283 RepID=UPI0012E9AB61|nr:hypothetical protein [Microbacterium karelineae]
MYILLALIVAAAAGTAAHFALPGRDLRGATLPAAIAVGSAAVIYAALTWTLGESSGWTWLIALIAPAAISVAATLAIVNARRRADAAERERLHI